MSSIFRGGGINDLPRKEILVRIASSRVICLVAQLKNVVDVGKAIDKKRQRKGIEGGRL
jgi:hypothetical protein